LLLNSTCDIGISSLNQQFTYKIPKGFTERFQPGDCRELRPMAFDGAMRWALLFGIVGLCKLPAGAEARTPLGDPVTLNIGINCQWQQHCIKAQTKAMKRALKYVGQTPLPPWHVQLCNRNAGRQRVRVDWIGFDNCIRNASLRPIPARVVRVTVRPTRKKVRRLTENAPPRPSAPGERG
jgi:hypothetical protein